MRGKGEFGVASAYGWEAVIDCVGIPLMWTSQTLKQGAIAFVAIAIAILLANLFSEPSAEQRIGSLLRLENVPSSLANAECESWGMTDVLATCSFELEPEQFSNLLTGWDFRQTPASGSSYEFSSGPKVGREFPIAVEFSASPSEFEHGGRISIVADVERSRVQLDYYEE